jgi:conjugal transfer ATP-binding protein TraC
MGLFSKKQKIVNEEEKALEKFSEGLLDVRDVISPSAIEVDFNHMLIGSRYVRTYFATDFPRFVSSNWLSPLINFEHPIDVSTFYYPVDSTVISERIRRKIAEMEATLNIDAEKGKVIDANVKVALDDARELQQTLASGKEKFFHYGLYISVRANTLKELEKVSRNMESTLASIGIIVKVATLQQEQGFQSVLPIGLDKLYLTRNMDTTSIATTFPFVSSDLTMEQGILYGINKHNRSLVIFDRFSIQNANMVVFATSGAGKSYMIKLEAVRSLMLGIDVIIIDPEREYEMLCESIGGEYISFSQDGSQKLNPFDLSGIFDQEEDELRFKILSLHGLLKLMLGGNTSPEEDALIDRAIILSYREKGITPDPSTHKNTAPLLEDVYKILRAMSEKQAHSIADRLERYLRGSAAGVFDQPSNVKLTNAFTVFSVRDLAEELRPMAIYMMLDFIWTRIKKDKKKRLLIIDEAWWMMRYPDSAQFLHSLTKRARKYGLGITTITQDVEDFLSSDYGKAIVTNSAIQVLMKQNPAAVDKIKKVFYLSEGEKLFLLSAGIGEGLFFAGSNHVAIQVIASENEHKLVTTNPNDSFFKEKNKQAETQQTQVVQPPPTAQVPPQIN